MPDREDHVLSLSVWKIIIIGGIIALLFGKGKISGMMGDVAQGIKAFKKGMSEDDSQPKALREKSAETVSSGREDARS
jgi:sec-independent protein translocase protein TatA